MYGDVVKIVRGDYGGIVDKLSGYGGTKDKDKIGPNIVYRWVTYIFCMKKC